MPQSKHDITNIVYIQQALLLRLVMHIVCEGYVPAATNQLNKLTKGVVLQSGFINKYAHDIVFRCCECMMFEQSV